MIEDKNNVQAAIDAGRALGTPINLEPAKSDSPLQLVVVPQNHSVQALEPLIEKFLPTPRRIKAHPQLTTATSFIDYVALFKNESTQVFASVPANNQPPVFLALIEYHSPEGPVWTDHKATYACRFTEEWARWMASDKKRMSQVEFATLLEENQALVVQPPGAELLELIQTLEGKNDITCNSLVRLNNGRQKLFYEENVELKGSVSTQQGQVEFPSKLVVAIAPFDGSPTYKIDCRLKYRIENRRLIFWYECVDVHLVIKEVVNDTTERIEEKLELTVLNGQP